MPVLFSQISPRDRSSHTRLRQNSASRNSNTKSASEPIQNHTAEARTRVPPIRPLSIATLSTFGAWMPHQNGVDEEGQMDYTDQGHEVNHQRFSERCRTRLQHTFPALKVPQYVDRGTTYHLVLEAAVPAAHAPILTNSFNLRRNNADPTKKRRNTIQPHKPTYPAACSDLRRHSFQDILWNYRHLPELNTAVANEYYEPSNEHQEL